MADELKMFFAAGKTREVPLDILFAMTSAESVEAIKKRLRFQGMMASMGMAVPSELDAIAARVAAYMGWIEEPEETPK